MSERFFAPDLNPAATEYLLSGPEAHHLASVLRAGPGTKVTLFNGAGLSAQARVLEAHKRETLLALVEFTTSPPLPPLTLATALPKGDRGTYLVEKGVELGITRLVPLRTARSVTHPAGEKIERLERAAIEAAKQCGRDYLPTIDPLTACSEFMSSVGSATGWMFDPSGEVLTPISAHRPDLIAIGPEGGWTEDEVESARRSGWKIIRWPGHILRVETAALVAVTLAQVMERHS